MSHITDTFCNSLMQQTQTKDYSEKVNTLISELDKVAKLWNLDIDTELVKDYLYALYHFNVAQIVCEQLENSLSSKEEKLQQNNPNILDVLVFYGKGIVQPKKPKEVSKDLFGVYMSLF